MKKLAFSSAFTLIELLVVISIIGILVAVSAFGLQGARESARDARRKADLETIRSGLELYHSDCNVYPTGSGSVVSALGASLSGSCPNSITYIQSVPNDPISDRNYYYSSDGSTYELCAAVETETGSAGCAGSCGITCSLRLTNP